MPSGTLEFADEGGIRGPRIARTREEPAVIALISVVARPHIL